MIGGELPIDRVGVWVRIIMRICGNKEHEIVAYHRALACVSILFRIIKSEINGCNYNLQLLGVKVNI